jgi:hypothetical protein
MLENKSHPQAGEGNSSRCYCIWGKRYEKVKTKKGCLDDTSKGEHFFKKCRKRKDKDKFIFITVTNKFKRAKIRAKRVPKINISVKFV